MWVKLYHRDPTVFDHLFLTENIYLRTCPVNPFLDPGFLTKNRLSGTFTALTTGLASRNIPEKMNVTGPVHLSSGVPLDGPEPGDQPRLESASQGTKPSTECQPSNVATLAIAGISTETVCHEAMAENPCDAGTRSTNISLPETSDFGVSYYRGKLYSKDYAQWPLRYIAKDTCEQWDANGDLKLSITESREEIYFIAPDQRFVF